MTNEQVARFLLARGLPTMEAAVFLDDRDKEMVVDRSGGPAIPLSQCGVSLDKRFTFYGRFISSFSNCCLGFCFLE